jgi:hypothetical protein
MGTGCSSLVQPSRDLSQSNREDGHPAPDCEEPASAGDVPQSQTFAGICPHTNPLARQREPSGPSQPPSGEIEISSPLSVMPASPFVRATVTNESFSSGTRHRKKLRPTVVQSYAKWTSTTERGSMPLMQSSQRSLDIRQWISDSNSFAAAENENDDGATASIACGDALSLSRQTMSTLVPDAVPV